MHKIFFVCRHSCRESLEESSNTIFFSESQESVKSTEITEIVRAFRQLYHILEGLLVSHALEHKI